MGTGLDPQQDYVFKRICGDEDNALLLIDLSKFNLTAEQVKTPLERWCYFFKHGASLDLDNLPATLDVPVIRKAVEVLVKISQSEREREWAEERKRAERDRFNWIDTARD